MTKKAKEAPPPPSLQEAYDALHAQYQKISADFEAFKAQAPETPTELEPLRLECVALRGRCEKAELAAEQSRNACAVAQRELAACEAQLKTLASALPAPPGANPYDRDPSARTFLYVKGNPKDPASPKERVKAQTQRQADQLAAALLQEGFVFRGCVG